MLLLGYRFLITPSLTTYIHHLSFFSRQNNKMHVFSLSCVFLLAGTIAWASPSIENKRGGTKINRIPSKSASDKAYQVHAVAPIINDECDGAVPINVGLSEMYNNVNATNGNRSFTCALYADGKVGTEEKEVITCTFLVMQRQMRINNGRIC